ncbi:MAG: YtxH domain-containing protein [Cyanobacteria bacterium NC_groundwater_1444_Ag_S-0.65um_54_12]|nr:YtxH domain-containing protein [Cyanobacteria bacterium NC_groundwater_1444_Ag_S-0.65um_54_12]
MSSPIRSLTFVAYALVGTAVGTVLGLILAPKSGAATRNGLRRLVGEMAAQFPICWEDLKQRATSGRQHRAPDASFIQLYREGGGG